MKILLDHIKKRITEDLDLNKLSSILINLGHENELINNKILDLEITPNRGDCFSLIGILRELKNFYKVDMDFEIYQGDLKEFKMDFSNNASDHCPSICFLNIEVEGVKEKYIPEIESFFHVLGVKKNNFFTDISNYLSYELGQPTHCYDADKISDKRIKLEVSNKQTTFKTVIGKEVNLKNSNLVFKCDEEIINLAGVMGGASTECSQTTKKVIIESAFFKPDSIIGKSTMYDINSDASHKFERGIDRSLQEKALRRFIYLVQQHAVISKMEIFKFSNNLDKKKPIVEFSVEKINKILGTALRSEDCKQILEKLDFRVNEYIEIPSHRHDISSLNDISEEVARVIGYDNIERAKIVLPNKKIENTSKENLLRDLFISNGFYEVITYPFVEAQNTKSIHIDNPLDSSKRFLRTSLKESLINNLSFNERRQKDSVKLFEISDVYHKDKDQILSKKRIGFIASGRQANNYEGFSKKISIKSLEDFLKDFYKDIKINTIPRKEIDSKNNTDVFYMETDLDNFEFNEKMFNLNILKETKFSKYTKVSDFPSVTRDISYTLNSIGSYDQLEKLLISINDKIIKEVFIFDYYVNPKTEQIKIGYRFILRSDEKTLKDSEVSETMEKIITESLKMDGISILGV